jgi:hypothetical protein
MGAAIECRPSFRDPKPRLALMDEQGLDRTPMSPTLASLAEERFRDDPEATHLARTSEARAYVKSEPPSTLSCAPVM